MLGKVGVLGSGFCCLQLVPHPLPADDARIPSHEQHLLNEMRGSDDFTATLLDDGSEAVHLEMRVCVRDSLLDRDIEIGEAITSLIDQAIIEFCLEDELHQNFVLYVE